MLTSLRPAETGRRNPENSHGLEIILRSKLVGQETQTESLIRAVRDRAAAAQCAAESIADAVRPVHALAPSKNKLEQIGSCVLVSIAGELFAFSAAHVLEQVGNQQVPIVCDGALILCPGERFSSKKGRSGTHVDDPVDAAVLHIASPPPASLAAAALSVDDLDLQPSQGGSDWFVAVGFRAKAVRVRAQSMTSRMDLFPSIEWHRDDYLKHGVAPQGHTVIAFEEQVLVGDKWQTAPTPRGMSGGALVRIHGLPADPTLPRQRAARPFLRSVITERHKGRQSLRGCNIGYHLGLIEKYLPGLLASAGVSR